MPITTPRMVVNALKSHSGSSVIKVKGRRQSVSVVKKLYIMRRAPIRSGHHPPTGLIKLVEKMKQALRIPASPNDR